MISKLKFLLLLLLILGFPNMVMAASDSWICVNGILYEVSESHGESLHDITLYYEMLNYIDEHNINVNAKENTLGYFGKNKEYEDFLDFKKKYKETFEKYGTSEGKDKFTVTSLNRRCTITWKDNARSWTSCPTDAQYNQPNAPFTTTKLEESVVKGFTFDQSRAQFYLEIKDNFNSALMVRVVRNGTTNAENYDYSSVQRLNYVGSNDNLYQLSDGKTQKIYFSRKETVRLEFYIKTGYSGDCAGALVGFLDDVAPSSAKVTNPWSTSKDSKYKICQDFRNSSNTTYSFIPTEYKKILVPECYEEKVDYFDELPNITADTIQEKINRVKSMFTAKKEAELSQLQCHYDVDGVKEEAIETVGFVFNPSGTSSSTTIEGDYWAASCTEQIKVVYDQPKKVISGGGFDYNVTLKVERTCTPFAKKVIKELEQCTYSSSCWGGPANHHGETGAGPNDDFDDCVASCDGGQYTKDCINQCYAKVYEGKDVEISGRITYQSTTFLDSMTVTPVAFTGSCATREIDSPNYCYRQNGWTIPITANTPTQTKTGQIIYEEAAINNHGSRCYDNRYCYSFHEIKFTYLNTCNSTSNPTICYEVYTSKAYPECSDNPAADSSYELAIAEAEYKELLAAIKEYEAKETTKISIIDSYKTDNGKKLTTTNTSESDMVVMTGGLTKFADGKTYEEKSNVRTEVYAIKGGSSLTKYVPSIKVAKEYTIQLPYALINQLTMEASYVTPTRYNNKKTEERAGGNKYYTDIDSGTFNNYLTWQDGHYPTGNAKDIKSTTGNNINVFIENIGTKHENGNYTWKTLNIDCFYGLLNQRYLVCDNEKVCEIPCGPNDLCTGGLQYYFRHVNLTDLFPDRNPRWNWTDSAKVYDNQYAVTPSEVIEDIESKGNAAYEEEPSYEINITRNDIREIRSANSKKDNYLILFDDTQCNLTDGKEVCKSSIDSYVSSITRNTELGTND